MSEVWRNADTETILWRGVPEAIFKENRYLFGKITVSKNVRAMSNTLNLILNKNPKAQIVVTVSPIPLYATMLGEKCFVADARSKSTIRAAVTETMDLLGSERIQYWPSFEMFKWLGNHKGYPTFMPEDPRHPAYADIAAVGEFFVETVIA